MAGKAVLAMLAMRPAASVYLYSRFSYIFPYLNVFVFPLTTKFIAQKSDSINSADIMLMHCNSADIMLMHCRNRRYRSHQPRHQKPVVLSLASLSLFAPKYLTVNSQLLYYLAAEVLFPVSVCMSLPSSISLNQSSCRS